MSGTSINKHDLTVADHVSRRSSNSDLALHVDLLARHERNGLGTARQGAAVYPLDLSRIRQFAQISTNRVFRDPVSTAKVRGEDSALTAKQLQDVLVALFLQGDLVCFSFRFHSAHCARIHLVMHVYTCII